MDARILYCSKACRDEHKKKRNHERYVKNRETILRSNREYHAKNREARLQHSREHYTENREALCQYGREYRAKNRKALVCERSETTSGGSGTGWAEKSTQ